MSLFITLLCALIPFVGLEAEKNDSLVPFGIQITDSQKLLQSDTPSRSLIEGTTPVIIHNHVHAITGSFFDFQTDLEIGSLNFALQRTYVSEDHTAGSLLHGWNHNCEEVLQTESHANHRYAVSKGKIGGEYLYRGYFGETSLNLDPKNFKRGVTNCASGEPSGRTNVINHRLKRLEGEKYLLKTGSGSRMHFKKVYGTKHFYQIFLQETPLKHRIEYSYDVSKKRIQKVDYQNPSKQTLATFHFIYPTNTELKQYSKQKKKRQKKPTIKIKASDGRKVTYTLEAFEKHHCDDSIDKRRYRITEVKRPNAPDEWYEYSKPEHCTPEQVIVKRRPEGRYLQIDYYDDKEKFLLGKVRALKGPSGNHPDPVLYYSFGYEKGSNSSKTIVHNGIGNRTIYHYSPKNFRLDEVEKFYGVYPHYALHSKEKLEWGEESKGSNLLSRIIYDDKQQIVMGRQYEYDNNGNVIKSHLIGNLTGKENQDRITKTCTYSTDGFNLITSVKDGDLQHDFIYKPGTELLIAKFTRAGEYHLREFYEYDENHAVSTIIHDDGSTRDCSDLTDVTERSIQRIKNLKGALAGLPETTEHLYLDLSSGHEILLKKVICLYDTLGHLIEKSVYDPDGVFLFNETWEYNRYGQKTLETNCFGDTTVFSYDLNGNLLSEQRFKDNRSIHYSYDLCNRLIKKEIFLHGDSFIETYDYDVMGNKIAERDHYGNKTSYHYDSQGQLCTITYPKALDDQGVEFEKKEFKEYDVLGNVTLEVDSVRNQTLKKYTTYGSPYSIQYPNGACEKFEYSLKGLLVKHTLINGSVVVKEYDPLSRPLVESTYDSFGNLLKKRTQKYSALHLIEETDEDGLTTYYFYDGAGRVAQIIQGNKTKTFTYDCLGRCIAENEADVIRKTTYDSLDRILSISTSNQNEELQLLQEFEYDADSNTIAEKKFNQVGTSIYKFEYDALGRITKKIDPLNHASYTFYRSVVLEGRNYHQVCEVDPHGNQEIKTYNELRQEISRVTLNRMGQMVKKCSFSFDRAGNQTKRIDLVIAPDVAEKEIVTTWTYDCMHRLTCTTEAAGSIEQRKTLREYDLFGNLIRLQKPDGVVLYYTYDSLGRMTRYYSSDRTVDYSFDYHLTNLPTKISDAIHHTTTERIYNIDKELILEKMANELSTSYTYDSMGRMSSIYYPDGSHVKYLYNGIFLKGVEKFNPEGNQIYSHIYTEYDLSGNLLQSDIIENQGTISYRYDLMNRVIEIATPNWTENNHRYDETGNLISREWNEQKHFYTYDPLYQLNTESAFAQNTFVNDSMHNQTVVNGISRSFNAAQELENVYRYDLNGNVVNKGNLTLKYDALNRLTQVIDEDKTITYYYDGFHRRIAKTTDHKTLYFYSGQLELGAVDELGTITELRVLGKQNLAEIGASIALELHGKIYIPLHDSQGNIVTLIDNESGKVVESIHYSAYGQEIDIRDITNKITPWRAASKRYDEETGFIYFGRRYYDPLELRWTTLDPILTSEGFNRYNYLKNNPFKYTDPDGRIAFLIPIAIWGATTTLVITTTEVVVATAAVAVISAGAYGATKYNIRVPSYDTWRWQLKPSLTRTPENIYWRSEADVATPPVAGPGDAPIPVPPISCPDTEERRPSAWVFPENPDELLPDLPRDKKGRIPVSDNIRIRPEKHKFETGHRYNPRHHEQHYHIETKKDPTKISWKNDNIHIIKPPGYKPMDGTGFLPGEFFPGIIHGGMI